MASLEESRNRKSHPRPAVKIPLPSPLNELSVDEIQRVALSHWCGNHPLLTQGPAHETGWIANSVLAGSFDDAIHTYLAVLSQQILREGFLKANR